MIVSDFMSKLSELKVCYIKKAPNVKKLQQFPSFNLSFSFNLIFLLPIRES